MNPKQADTSLRSLISPVRLAKNDAVGGTDAVAGTIFYKQLFSFGTWANPMWWWDGEPTMELTVDLATKMVANFNANVLGSKVPVPRNHTDDVNANTGEVVKLEVGTDGLYGYLEIKDQKTVDDINNGLIFDVSIGFDWDYISQKDSTHYGPTLFHVALVNTPYINNMTGFTEAELSRRNAEYAKPLAVNGRPSVIMMSISKVEELKRMTFTKVSNDKAFAVEVKFTDAEGNEQTETVAAGGSVDVPETVAEDVKRQVSEAVESTTEDDNKGETDEEREAREKTEREEVEAKQRADDEAAAKAAAEKPVGEEEPLEESEKEELARLRTANAELSANEAYSALLAKGKITPAQKDLFIGLCKSAGSVTLSQEVKGVKLAKGSSTTSVTTMLSAILEAGPQVVKFSEQGGQGKKGGDAEDGKAELSKEDEARVKRMGFNVETFKKQLAKGTISLNDLEEEK